MPWIRPVTVPEMAQSFADTVLASGRDRIRSEGEAARIRAEAYQHAANLAVSSFSRSVEQAIGLWARKRFEDQRQTWASGEAKERRTFEGEQAKQRSDEAWNRQVYAADRADERANEAWFRTLGFDNRASFEAYRDRQADLNRAAASTTGNAITQPPYMPPPGQGGVGPSPLDVDFQSQVQQLDDQLLGPVEASERQSYQRNVAAYLDMVSKNLLTGEVASEAMRQLASQRMNLRIPKVPPPQPNTWTNPNTNATWVQGATGAWSQERPAKETQDPSQMVQWVEDRNNPGRFLPVTPSGTKIHFDSSSAQARETPDQKRATNELKWIQDSHNKFVQNMMASDAKNPAYLGGARPTPQNYASRATVAIGSQIWQRLTPEERAAASQGAVTTDQAYRRAYETRVERLRREAGTLSGDGPAIPTSQPGIPTTQAQPSQEVAIQQMRARRAQLESEISNLMNQVKARPSLKPGNPTFTSDELLKLRVLRDEYKALIDQGM